jgi:hypothetical protein
MSISLASPLQLPMRRNDLLSVVSVFFLFCGGGGAQASTEALIGLRRLKAFLMLENRARRFPRPQDANNAIEIQGATFAWTAIQRTESTREAAGTPAATMPMPPAVVKPLKLLFLRDSLGEPM